MRQTTAATTGTTRETAARKAAIKREQSQIYLSFAERELVRTEFTADSFDRERAALLRQLGPLGLLLAWLDRHPRTAAALLWLMAAALFWVVFTYNFTIPAYK